MEHREYYRSKINVAFCKNNNNYVAMNLYDRLIIDLKRINK